MSIRNITYMEKAPSAPGVSPWAMVRRAYSPGVYPVRPVGPPDDSQGRNPWPFRVPGIIIDRRPSVYYRLDYDGASARLAAVFRGGGDDGFTGIDIVLVVSIVCLY